MIQELPDTLATLEKEFEALPNEFGLCSAALAKFYKMLHQLQTQGFFCKVAFSEILNGVPALPERIGELLKYAQQAFDVQARHAKMSQCLQELENLLDDPRYRYLPETRLLAREARRWLDYLRLLSTETVRPAKITLDISPSLDLMVKEEDEAASGRFVNLPVILLNEGPLPAEEVHLLLKLDSGKIDHVANAEKLPDGSYRTKQPFVIDAGQSQLYYIPLNYSQESKIEIRAEFKDFLARAEEPPQQRVSELLLVKLPVPARAASAKLKNPYIPDLPLTSEEDWNELMKGEQRGLVEKIIGELNAHREQGYLYFIRGLKRTGKSSVLYQLRRRLQETGKYLPVYIDFHLWRENVYDRTKDKRINGVELFYELAVAAAKEAIRLVAPNQDKEKTESSNVFVDSLQQYQETMSMKYHEFNDFVKMLSENSRKRVIFLLDELDSWFQVKEFHEDAQSLLAYISSLAGKGIFSAILAHEWNNEEWERKFLDEKINPLYKPVQFLGEEAVTELFRLAHLPYTEMAREFVWRFTGGWPSLVQLLFYRLVEEIQKRGNRRALVDLGMIKDVASDILASTDNRSFIKYFLGSLDEAEIKALELLNQTNAIQKDSSQIKGIRLLRDETIEVDAWIEERWKTSNGGRSLDLSKALANLFRKQIIARVFDQHKRCRLRVGFLAFNHVLDLFQAIQNQCEAIDITPENGDESETLSEPTPAAQSPPNKAN